MYTALLQALHSVTHGHAFNTTSRVFLVYAPNVMHKCNVNRALYASIIDSHYHRVLGSGFSYSYIFLHFHAQGGRECEF